MVAFLTITKNDVGRVLSHPFDILLDEDTIHKMDDLDIEFGIKHDSNNFFTGLVIIRQGKSKLSEIKDRSVSKLICGIKYKKRRIDVGVLDFTKSAYLGNKLNEQGIPDFSLLDIDELEYLIEYLNMLLIKTRVESSEKLTTILNKLENE